MKGFEPSTPTLARLCSTPELHPQYSKYNTYIKFSYIIIIIENNKLNIKIKHHYMLKKNFILINLGSKNNLYLINIIFDAIAIHKKLINPIFSKNNTYFLNLKSNLC